MKRTTQLVGLTLVAALMLTGCGQNNFRDKEGVASRDADEYTLWNNVDGHPNVVRLCLDGVAFATTTRDLQAIMRVPEWDKHCAEVPK